jgi:Tfp pilus assembly protein PilF
MTKQTNLTLSKDQLDAIAVLGYRFFEQGKNHDAETLFEGLVALDPKLYYGYAGLGAMALREERLDEAVEHLSQAVALKPEDATVYANLGEALLRKGQFNESAAEFEHALALDPDHRDPGANRARAILNGLHLVVNEIQRVGVTQ